MFNTKLLTYDISIPKRIHNALRKVNYDDKVILAMIVCNLLSAIRNKCTIVYSRDKSEYPVNTKRSVTVRQVIRCVEFMVEEGYVINIVGKASKHPDFRSVSTLTPTEKFMQGFLTIEDIKECEQNYLDAVQGVVLRGANKKAMSFAPTDETERMKAIVADLNKLNESASILTKEGQRLSNIYSRIFNESFDFGGRFYRADILQLHNKDGQQRLDITINGSPVVEIDFQNLHFRIAAVLEDMEMQYIPNDMYADILDDPSNKVDRSIVKLAVNIMFNCRSQDAAKRAIQGEINSLSIEDKKNYTLGNSRMVMTLIEHNYMDFVHLFCNEDSFGRILQNMDSHLASDIVEVFITKEIPVLCVHDSFIVAHEHADLLAATMAEKFRKRFQVDCPVPLTAKYRDADTNEVIETKFIL